MKNIILLLIKIYQKTISPDHGFFPVLKFLGGCRHNPTCSQYTHEAVKEKGALKVVWLGIKRISNCHPWGKEL